jgi:DNA-binding response OmpR family regulator
MVRCPLKSHSGDDAGNILIIEDEECVREMLVVVLTREGYKPWSAENAERARELFQRHDTSLIITDIFMPGTDGLELISEFKTLYPSLPIIAISGGSPSGAGGYLSAARQLGADIALPKPFRPREIRAAVDTLISGQFERQAT